MATNRFSDSYSTAGDVNNHSHSRDSASVYGPGAASDDAYVRVHDTALVDGNNIHVYGAGNTATFRGYFSMQACPKNPIKVGNCQKYTGRQGVTSSMGPTYDGRIGPDVVAPGSGALHFEKWAIEMDYIRWKDTANVIKKAWEFNGTLGWSSVQMDSSRIGPGDSTLCIFGPDRRYGFGSIQCSTLTPTVRADGGDSIIIRLRVADSTSVDALTKGVPRPIHIKLYTTPSKDPLVPNENSGFYAQMNDGWQVLRIPIEQANQYAVWSHTVSEYCSWPRGSDLTVMKFEFHPLRVLASLHEDYQHGLYDYVDLSGTSMAAPHVTGLIALMLQKWGDKYLGDISEVHDHPFWNSTARAILVHTASDLVDTSKLVVASWAANPDYIASSAHDTIRTLHGPGPDWVTGYGLVNAVRAVAYVDTQHFSEDTIGNAEMMMYDLHVPQGTDTLRVTLAWDDVEAPEPNSTSTALQNKLVNDLNVYLLPPNCDSVYRPWVLFCSDMHGDTIPTADYIDESLQGATMQRGIHPDSVLSRYSACRGVDTVNNLEVVHVFGPDTGTWTVVVEARHVDYNQSLSGSDGDPRQDYSVVHDFSLAAAQQGPDALGPRFRYYDTTNVMVTRNGNPQLRGTARVGTPTGLRFNSAAAVDVNGDLIAGNAFYTDQGTWLDTQSLSDGLVWRAPNGVAAMHMSSSGDVRVRGTTYEGFDGL